MAVNALVLSARSVLTAASQLHAEKSRKGGNVTKDMQQYFFALTTHSQRNSGKHVLYHIYLPRKMKAEPDFSLVWDKALVRYK